MRAAVQPAGQLTAESAVQLRGEPGLFVRQNYDSTGRRVAFQPACLPPEFFRPSPRGLQFSLPARCAGTKKKCEGLVASGTFSEVVEV